jgi:hypothetical protein
MSDTRYKDQYDDSIFAVCVCGHAEESHLRGCALCSCSDYRRADSMSRPAVEPTRETPHGELVSLLESWADDREQQAHDAQQRTPEAFVAFMGDARLLRAHASWLRAPGESLSMEKVADYADMVRYDGDGRSRVVASLCKSHELLRAQLAEATRDLNRVGEAKQTILDAVIDLERYSRVSSAWAAISQIRHALDGIDTRINQRVDEESAAARVARPDGEPT